MKSRFLNFVADHFLAISGATAILWCSLLVFSVLWLCGCASTRSGDESAIHRAHAWLGANGDNLQRGLVLTGIAAMDQLHEPERRDISNQMWAAATLFNSLAGEGKILTTKELEKMLSQYAPSWNAHRFQAYREGVALVYGLARARIEDLLRSNVPGDIEAARVFLNSVCLLLAAAAQKVAEHYQP